MQNNNSKKLYLNLKMPKFIWVCEISTIKHYKNNKILGEIVLDSTSSIQDKLNSLIFIRYQNRITINKDNNFDKLKELLSYKINIKKEFGIFDKNLEGVGNE
jgi:hypothetical protein